VEDDERIMTRGGDVSPLTGVKRDVGERSPPKGL
jgi:hypothetical protein